MPNLCLNLNLKVGNINQNQSFLNHIKQNLQDNSGLAASYTLNKMQVELCESDFLSKTC